MPLLFAPPTIGAKSTPLRIGSRLASARQQPSRDLLKRIAPKFPVRIAPTALGRAKEEGKQLGRPRVASDLEKRIREALKTRSQRHRMRVAAGERSAEIAVSSAS
jgi:hypothetical protein